MRIACDTNVLVSGMLFAGNCRAIIGLVSEGRVDGFTSSALVAELEGVLHRSKFGLSAPEVEAIVHLVHQTFCSVSPGERLNVVVEDPNNDAVLEAGVAAVAEVIVSGDAHLLNLAVFRGTRILSPARFVAEFNRQQRG